MSANSMNLESSKGYRSTICALFPMITVQFSRKRILRHQDLHIGGLLGTAYDGNAWQGNEGSRMGQRER